MKKSTMMISLVFLPLFLFSCKTAKENKEFENRFEAAKKSSGLKEAPVVERGRGKDLQTNVQRLGLPTPPAGIDKSETLPPTLEPAMIARVIRRRVSRLRYCLLGKNIRKKAGKAIITLSIIPSGRVSSVKVEAPSFAGTNVAECVKRSASLWKFPKFGEGKITHSYPVIFSGR